MLPCLLSCLVLPLLVSARAQVHPPPLAESLVRCGVDTIGFTMPREALGSGQVLLSVRDDAGILVDVGSVPSRCRFELERRPDGSLGFSAPNDGCYASSLGARRRMVFVMETTSRGMASVQTFSVSCSLGPRSLAVGNPECPVSQPSRPPCDGPSPGRDACVSRGCCYDDAGGDSGAVQPTCVYGNSVCTRDGHFVLVVPRGPASGLNLSSVRVQGAAPPDCGLVHRDPHFAVFRFPVGKCGAVRRMEGGGVVYEATVTSEREVCVQDGVVITRSGTHSFTLRCRYAGAVEGALEAVGTLGLEVPSLAPSPAAQERGHLDIEMRVATDGTYSTYHSVFPVTKVLRDPIFLEVRLLEHADPSLVVFLPTCWATPGPNSTGQILWPLVQDGCPFDGDNYKTLLRSVEKSPEVALPGHYKRFEVKTFVFVVGSSQNAIYDRVFFHCTAVVCRDGNSNCVPPPCVVPRQREALDAGNSDWDARLPRRSASVGPVRLLEVPDDLPMQLREARAASVWNDSMPPQVPTVLSALALGTALLCGVTLSVSACRRRRHRRGSQGQRPDPSAVDHFTL